MSDDLDTGADGAESGEETPQRRSSTAGMTRDQYHEREKAAFLASLGEDDEGGDGGDNEGGSGDKPTTKHRPKRVVGREVAEDDEGEGESTEDDGDRAHRSAKPARKPAPPTEEDEEDEEPDDDQGEEDELDDDDDDDDEDPGEDEDPDPDDDEDDLAAKDPELARRLAAVRRTEQRHRERLGRDRTEFERERSAWQTESRQHREELERFRGLAARAKFDPYSVMRALGAADDDMEYLGQQLFAHSKAAAAKGQGHREAAERAMREREHTDELSRTRGEVEELKKGLAARDLQAAQDRELDVYFARVTKKADDTTPRVKALIASTPKRARAELSQTAYELAQKLGKLPKPAAVLAAHEKKIARQLRAYGVDAPAPGKASKMNKGKAAKSGAPSAKPGSTKPVKPAAGAVTFPTRDEMIRELEEREDMR